MLVRMDADHIAAQDGTVFIQRQLNGLRVNLRDRANEPRFAITTEDMQSLRVVDRYRPQEQPVLAVIIISGPMPAIIASSDAWILQNVTAWDVVDGDGYDR